MRQRIQQTILPKHIALQCSRWKRRPDVNNLFLKKNASVHGVNGWLELHIRVRLKLFFVQHTSTSCLAHLFCLFGCLNRLQSPACPASLKPTAPAGLRNQPADHKSCCTS